MQIEQKRAVIYCRVSTKEQVEEGNSLVTQEKHCREYALKNGFDVTEVFIEQGESAKTAQRTELQRLLSFCSIRNHGIRAVIAYKIDRVSRNTDDYSQIRLLLKRYGVEIKSTSEYFENTPAGRFMENIIANVAQFDNDVRTERCVGGMREAIREGRYVWMAPIGYNNVKIGDKTNIAPSSMAPFMRKAFTEIAKNSVPIEEVRRRLIQEGLRNKKGIPIGKSLFHYLIRNELYAGWITQFGERHKGAFEPLTTDETFAQVQRVLKQRGRRVSEYKLENPDFPLRRFISHPAGGKLTGCWCKGRTKHYAYYRFQQQKMDFKKNLLETAFKKFLDCFELDEDNFSKLRNSAKNWLIQKCSQKIQERQKAEQLAKDLTEKRALLVGKNLQGVISDEILKEQLGLIERSMTDIYPTLQEQEPISASKIDGLFRDIEAYLRTPSAAWEKAPFGLKLRLQWFNFPKGLLFDGEKFQTTELCRLYKVKSSFLGTESNIVHHSIKPTNHTTKKPWISTRDVALYGNKSDLLYCDDLHWNGIINDIISLSKIVKDEECSKFSINACG